MARPRKDTEETVRKLEEGAAMDCDVDEMCSLADISRDTYYRWIKEDKVLSDRLDKLRQEPFLKARRAIVKGVAENYGNAIDYMKRKKKVEFGDNMDVTSGNKPLPILTLDLNEIQSNNVNKKDNSTKEKD